MKYVGQYAFANIVMGLGFMLMSTATAGAAVTPIESSLRIQNVAHPPSGDSGIGSGSDSQGPTIDDLFARITTNRSSHLGSVDVYTYLNVTWDHPEFGEQSPSFGRTRSYVYHNFDADISSNYYAWGAWSYYKWNYTFNLDAPDTFVFTPHGELSINGRLDPLDDSINFSLDDAVYQNLAGTQYIPLDVGEHTVSFYKSIYTRKAPVITTFEGYVDWHFASVPEPTSTTILSITALILLRSRRHG